ncbi:hypothetical protein CK203_103418 [Vitis vinifera]|uniref:Uncharacterized protein n=1 Tax=Vitis vinifera TaxID=29760 RepID=A0A438BQQ9_VITVI|nr:hypothetical protein CK203_103418 [Vitis vinifera]
MMEVVVENEGGKGADEIVFCKLQHMVHEVGPVVAISCIYFVIQHNFNGLLSTHRPRDAMAVTKRKAGGRVVMECDQILVNVILPSRLLN